MRLFYHKPIAYVLAGTPRPLRKSCLRYNTIMILLGALIVAVLFVLSCALGGTWAPLAAHFDLPALFCVLLVTAVYAAVCGSNHFFTGLQALLHRPKEHRTDVADYFRKLSLWTLAVGVGLPMTIPILGVLPIDNDVRTIALAMLPSAILVCIYSGWLTLLIYMPIAYRLSGGDSNFIYRLFATAWALWGIVLLFAIFIGMTLFNAIPTMDAVGQLGFCCFPMSLFDFPSLVLVVATLGACRLGMGRLQHCRDLIPISIFIGVLWSLHGMILIQSTFDYETFIPGFMVGMLTTLYGCGFALLAAMNRPKVFWIFMLVVGILLVLLMSFALMLMLVFGLFD